MKTMFRKILTFMILLIAAPLSVQAASMGFTWEKPVGFIRTSAYTAAPEAFLKFCKAHPGDCKPDTAMAGRFVLLDAARMRELNTVNTDVNGYYIFNTDLRGRD